MENNYKLEKEYKISYDIFEKAYRTFQKKSVMPRSYLFMGLFLAIAVIYILAVIKDPSSKLAYVLIVVSLALAVREWFNPRKIRRNVLEAIRENDLENEVYKICVAEEYVEISTLPKEIEILDAGEEDLHEELPEASRIPVNDDLRIYEYDEFFLMHLRNAMFYVIPKEGFTEDETAIIRNIKA